MNDVALNIELQTCVNKYYHYNMQDQIFLWSCMSQFNIMLIDRI